MATKKAATKKAAPKKSAQRSLASALKTDDTFERFRNIVRSVKEQVNVTDIQREYRLIHSNRKTRLLAGNNPGAKRLYDAVAQDLSDRSRLTEMKVQITPLAALLNRGNRAMESHLRTTYSDKLATYGTTVEAKKIVTRRVIESGLDVLDTLDVCLDNIDSIIKDIDQAGFSTGKLVNLLEIITERHGRVA